MAWTHDEILRFIADELQELALLCEARPNRCPHLDEIDIDFTDADEAEVSVFVQLEQQASLILKEDANA